MNLRSAATFKVHNMGIKFTEEQNKVIEVRNKNVLVSAAAGSGKTAVLVERIIRMITDLEHPVDIDRLLVVTFTEAAAMEMRERIAKALDKALEENPTDERLQRQAALLYKAQISTIHSFCLNIIRNNFYVCGLDPSFRVADETELKLMREDVLNELFEELYKANDKAFLDLSDYYNTGASDSKLKEYVYKLYDFAEGHPWPEEWLKDLILNYKNASVDELLGSEWVEYVFNYSISMISGCLNMIEEIRSIANKPNGPKSYLTTMDLDENELILLKNSKNIKELGKRLEQLKFATLAPAKGEIDESLKKQAQGIRNAYKDIILSKDKSGSVISLVSADYQSELEDLNSITTVIHELIKVTLDFSARFKEKRTAKGIISFSDMEHYALDILYTLDKETGEHIPSTTAIEYQGAYDEILMDEYQDCNRVQEALISSISGEDNGHYNRFMVGDVKQSIYKFRLANPELFISKYNCYRNDDYISQCDNSVERIDLHANFRSRENVINSVNDLFGQIMHEDLGGVEYDEDAHLVCGADYPPYEDERMEEMSQTEYLFMELDNESDLKKGVQEAQLIAEKIKSLVGHFSVMDKETKLMHPASYRDIYILVRSMTDVADGLKQVLSNEGIPAVMNLNSGFYDTREIQTILQMLKIIDNPMQDIALYGGLHSFFGGMSDEEIAQIKITADIKSEAVKTHCLYEKLVLLRENTKIDKFLSLIDDYRRRSVYTPIHILVRELVTETGYLNYVSALSGGKQRRANINMLIAKAAAYENTSYKGLFHFIRYVKELRALDADDGEADVLDDNADVVHIMTIHKSKGLEFPICILAGVHKQFNMDDIKGDISIDMDFGIGATRVDLDRRIKYDTLYKRAVNLKLKQDVIGEELRVLYVAMTRAREKLIITGCVKDGEALIGEANKLKELSGNTGRMPYKNLAEARSYMDMLLPALAEAKIVKSSDIDKSKESEAIDRITRHNELIRGIRAIDDENSLYKKLKERMGLEYPHKELVSMVPKTSVSELKHAYIDTTFADELFKENEEVKEYLPKFISDEDRQLSGTDRGSAYHRVMELLDFSDLDIKSQINKLINNERISIEWGDAVNVNKIKKLLESTLGERMALAQRNSVLYREQPFVLGISADRVKGEYPDTETILLQGIIDAFFVENNEIILVDYKTDVIKTAQELLDRYKVQLQYYKEALQRITGLKVKECILYSFNLDEVISTEQP